jgi:hypothetical protein
MATARQILAEPEIRCIGCACTDVSPCFGPEGACFWVAVDEASGRGLCSACAVKPLDELIARMNLTARGIVRGRVIA